ncbi:hypothetical protein BC832DRAFT_152192 [Gaertneriomyces semiglobifer]|nr:hypothetical protein BC832DRAFT_152192 [Gaertneriomyces semiglobifer]
MFAALRKKDVSAVRSMLHIVDPGPTKRSSEAATTGSGSFGSLSRNKSRKLRVDPNERDEQGNCPIHVAVASGSADLLHALLQCPSLNINAQDLESGYTALHRCLYNGDINLALAILQERSDVDVHLKDKEGLSCFDLLMLGTQEESTYMIQDWHQGRDNGHCLSAAWKQSSGRKTATDTITYEDDEADETSLTAVDQGTTRVREKHQLAPSISLWTWGSNSNFILSHPHHQNLGFPTLVTLPETATIRSIAFSKYHTAVLTSDGLYMNGFGRAGRLGLGNEETAITARKVEGIRKIRSVALGSDHTVALTSTGSVWTWGSNRYGQLGYSTDQIANGHGCQLTPKEVMAFPKRMELVAAAASKFHTAVVSSAGTIYTWGLNIGQLGYLAPPGSIQATPMKVTAFPTQDIVCITATNRSTAILTHSREVYVFSSFSHQRVIFPFHYPSKLKFHRPRWAGSPSIVKLVSGNHMLAAVSTWGDVFLWAPPEPNFGSSSSTSAGGAIKDDRPEDLFFARPTPEMIYQTTYFPQSRPRRVWHGRYTYQYAVDVAIGIDSSLLIATASRHAYVGTRQNISARAVSRREEDVRYYQFNRIPFLQHIEKVIASSSGGYGAMRVDPRPWIDKGELAVQALQKDLQDVLRNLNPDMGLAEVDREPWSDLVLLTSDGNALRAHRAILLARLPILHAIFEEFQAADKSEVVSDLGFVLRRAADHETYELIMKYHSATVKRLLELLYTAHLWTPWEYNRIYPKASVASDEAAFAEAVYREFTFLTNMLHSDALSASSDPEGHVYGTQMSKIYARKGIFDDITDVILELSDQELRLHQIFLGRSPFFEALLSSRWTLRYRDKRAVISMPHLRGEVVVPVIRWLYGAQEIREVKRDLEFTIEVLAVADELMLDTVKQQCGNILAGSLTAWNVVDILEIAITYSVPSLREACLDFVGLNLETILESTLSSLEATDVVNAIQQHVKQMASRRRESVIADYARVKTVVAQSEMERKRLRREHFEKHQYEDTHVTNQGSEAREEEKEDWEDDHEEIFSLDMGASCSGPELPDEQVHVEIVENKKTLSSKKRKDKGWVKFELRDRNLPSTTPATPPFPPARSPQPLVNRQESLSAKDVSVPWNGSRRESTPSFREILEEEKGMGSMIDKDLNTLSVQMTNSRHFTPHAPPGPSSAQVPVPPSVIRKVPSLLGDQSHPGNSWRPPVMSPKGHIPASSPTKLRRPPARQAASPSQSSPAPFPVDVKPKMSQKERRKSARDAKAIPPASASPNNTSNPWGTPVSTPKAAWNSPSKGAPELKSLAQIQVEESQHASPSLKPLKAKHRDTASPWHIANPVLPPTALRPPTLSTQPTLQSIQAEEQRQAELLRRKSGKPIDKIQKEEEAIKALASFYEMTKGIGTGEWIVVRRG